MPRFVKDPVTGKSIKPDAVASAGAAGSAPPNADAAPAAEQATSAGAAPRTASGDAEEATSHRRLPSEQTGQGPVGMPSSTGNGAKEHRLSPHRGAKVELAVSDRLRSFPDAHLVDLEPLDRPSSRGAPVLEVLLHQALEARVLADVLQDRLLLLATRSSP